MRKGTKILLLLSFGCILRAADIQGVVADWKCTEQMVKDGREKVLRENSSCSLQKNYDRPEYGLITDDKKFYRMDEAGNKQVRELLSNSPTKDNLKVVVRGDLDGNMVKVKTSSLL